MKLFDFFEKTLNQKNKHSAFVFTLVYPPFERIKGFQVLIQNLMEGKVELCDVVGKIPK